MPESFQCNCPTHSTGLRKAAFKTFSAGRQSLIDRGQLVMCFERDKPKFYQHSREKFWEPLHWRKVMVVSQFIDSFFIQIIDTEYLLYILGFVPGIRDSIMKMNMLTALLLMQLTVSLMGVRTIHEWTGNKQDIYRLWLLLGEKLRGRRW